MKKLILSLVVVSIAFNCFSQNITSDIKGKKVGDFISLEKKYKSLVFDDHQKNISFNQDLAQPIIFRRIQKGLPDLLVYYTFSKTDSLLDNVLYEWDDLNFEKGEGTKKPLAYSVALIKKYNELLKTLIEKFGKSTSTGDLSDLSKIENKHGLQRTDNWKPDETTEIRLYTVISNYYEKDGAVTITPSHRIRLYIYNVKKKIDPKFDSNQVASANALFEDLMAKLKTEDFEGIKPLLNQKIITAAIDNQLKAVKALINFSRKTKVYMQGFQIGTDGKPYLMLQYQYEDDQNSPPMDLIKVIFGQDGKIYGFSPITRRTKD
jgi:hypothetical protein